jgi:hypothetical protein
MRRGIGERVDNLQLFDDRAGPAVRDDERQCIVMLRTDVDEMNVEPIDLGDELRQGVQPGLALAPVVLGRPVPCEGLNRGELHALRGVRNWLPFGELGRLDAPAQIGEVRLRHIHLKRTNRGLVGCLLAGSFGNSGWCHADLLLRAYEIRCTTSDLSDEGIGDTFVWVPAVG